MALPGVFVRLRLLLGFRLFLARNFLKRAFEQPALFFARAAPDGRDIQKSNEHGETGEDQANQPENKKGEGAQSVAQHGFTGQQHSQRRQQENGAPPAADYISSPAHERRINQKGFQAEKFPTEAFGGSVASALPRLVSFF
jgi:hypothetical protein